MYTCHQVENNIAGEASMHAQTLSTILPIELKMYSWNRITLWQEE